MRAPRGDVEVVQRVGSPALTPEERRSGSQGDHDEADDQCPLAGDDGEIDRQHQSRDQEDGQDAAEVVHRFGRLVGMRGDEQQGHDQRDRGEGQGDQEHRPPVEAFEQRARDHGPEHGDAASQGGPQRDRLRPPRPRPQGGDQRQGGRVGHAGREPAEDPCHREDGVVRRERGEQAGGDGQRDAEEQQQLAPVPVADRTQIEH
nr:hypothetical protein [Streptomyces sp. WAC05950]